MQDRQHGNDFIGDFEEGRKRMEGYIRALEKEIAKRRQVVELLTQGKKYYDSLQGEAEIVATVRTFSIEWLFSHGAVTNVPLCRRTPTSASG